MAEFTAVIAGPDSGTTYQADVGGQGANRFLGRGLGDEIDGAAVSLDGFTLGLMGGLSKAGRPMHPDVPGNVLKEILVEDGINYKPSCGGERKCVIVRSHEVSNETIQINAEVVADEGDIAAAFGEDDDEEADEQRRLASLFPAPEQLSSDHPSVQTFRTNAARSDGTRRPCLCVPDDVTAADGDFVRLHLGGTAYHARPSADASGPAIRSVYDNKRLARTPNDGENRLVEWCREHNRADGDTVELDKLDDGYQYGFRVLGVRQVYRITERPNDLLSSIAGQFGPSDE